MKLIMITLTLAALTAFTIADGINNINSGVYADAHGLNGSSVGWFAPLGVPIFVLLALITTISALYFLESLLKLKK